MSRQPESAGDMQRGFQTERPQAAPGGTQGPEARAMACQVPTWEAARVMCTGLWIRVHFFHPRSRFAFSAVGKAAIRRGECTRAHGPGHWDHGWQARAFDDNS